MFRSLAPVLTLVSLSGGTGLLLYALRILSKNLKSLGQTSFQRWLQRMARRPLLALGSGMISTVLMQSSNATTSLLIGLVNAEALPLTSAILMLLGANIGSALIVQLFAWHLANYALEMVGLGIIAALISYRMAWRSFGQGCFAFSILILGLFILGQAGQALGKSSLASLVLHDLAGIPALLFLLGMLLCMLFNSSTAAIALILLFTENRDLLLASSLALLLGANVGTTITTALAALVARGAPGRRLTLIHVGTKAAGAIVCLLLLSPLTCWLSQLVPNPEMLVVLTHLGFNIGLAAIFAPLAWPLAHAVEKLLPASTKNEKAGLRPQSERSYISKQAF